MASAGAQCEHVKNVSTQLPYANSVAIISFIAYIVSGITQKMGIVASAIISWIIALVVLYGFLFFMKSRKEKTTKKAK